MAIITEDYVSFEIAKLLKEKEFNEKCTRYYKNKKYLVDLGYTNIHSYTNSDLVEEFAAPTLQMAMKWLREVHNIAINTGWGEILEDKFQWWCIILNQKDGSILRESEYYATYEEACEAAIKYCLENLI